MQSVWRFTTQTRLDKSATDQRHHDPPPPTVWLVRWRVKGAVPTVPSGANVAPDKIDGALQAPKLTALG